MNIKSIIIFCISAVFLLSCSKQDRVSLPSTLRGSWPILSHIPLQGKWQDGIEIDSSLENNMFIHQLVVSQDRIQEIHIRSNFQDRIVSNITYQVLTVSEANGVYRLELEQLDPDGNVNKLLTDRYFLQHIELMFHKRDSEWRFYYDTWNYQTYYCVDKKIREGYPVFDWSKDKVEDIIPGKEKVYD